MKSHRHKLFTAIKFLVILGVFWLLHSKGFFSLAKVASAFQKPQWIALAFIVQILSFGASTVRWQWLLQARGIDMPYRKTLSLALVGNFFNLALPGAVSGDIVKIFYLRKMHPSHSTEAFGTVIIDRILGLASVVFISAGALAFGGSHADMPQLQTFVFLLGVSGFLFFIYLLFIDPSRDPVIKVLGSIPKLGQLFHSVRAFQKHRWIVLRALALSIAVHALIGASVTSYMQCFEGPHLALNQILFVVPIGLLVTAIPVMPGGVGTGHAAFLWLFHLYGNNQGANVFTLLVLGNAMIAAIGGFLYLRLKVEQGLPPSEDDGDTTTTTSIPETSA